MANTAAWLREKAKVPETPFGQFVYFLVTEFLSSLILVANARAFTQGRYFWTAVTEVGWGGQSFVVWKLMFDDPNARSWWAGAGMVLGSTIGALLSIFITKHVYGE